MKPADHADVELEQLIGLFFDDATELGRFTEVDAEQIPDRERAMLAHDCHMTVAVEKHHGCAVNVQVEEAQGGGAAYSRKIRLTRKSDDCVVQFGIVRLDLTVLDPEVREMIESQGTPLGRVLIDHNVLREVRLLNLYRVTAGTALAECFGIVAGTVVYGRTAMIWCNGMPAIELLEIIGNS